MGRGEWRRRKLEKATMFAMLYALTRGGKYRMYAVNYLIDLAWHGRDMRMDALLHVINELVHGLDVGTVLKKLIRYRTHG